MSVATKITILCENMVGRMGSAEHGFAAYIERNDGNFLFDTGSGRFIIDNSLVFEKDLRHIKKIFISHGHDDHTGGLTKVLRLTGEVPLYAHPDIFLDRIVIRQIDGKDIMTYKGIPFKKNFLESLGAQFRSNWDFIEVADQMYLTGKIPRETDFETPDPLMKCKIGDDYVIDPFTDEQSLILKTRRGLVIIFGCAHSGMINTIRYAMRKTGEERIHGIIGGTHLGFLSTDQLEASIRELKLLTIDFIGVSHCTGFYPAARLFQEFGERFRYGHVGAKFEV